MKRRNKYGTCISLFALITFTAHSQTWQWAKSAGGTSSDAGFSVNIGIHGNIYCQGDFFSNTFFMDTDTLINNGQSSLFLAKLSDDGVLQNIIKGGGNSIHNAEVIPQDLTTDNSGNLYSVGGLSGFITFDTVTQSGYGSGYIAKFNSEARCKWVKTIAGSNSLGETVTGIATDNDENIYAVGELTSAYVHLDTFTLQNPDGPQSSKMFSAKMDSNGRYLWAKQGFNSTSILRRCAYNNGKLYAIGYSDTCFVFDTGSVCPGSKNIAFISCQNAATGTILWVAPILHSDLTSLNVHNAGNIYISAVFDSVVNVGGHIITAANTSSDILFAKLDSMGTFQWVKSIHSTGVAYCNAVSVDATGNCYFIGGFSGSAVFGDDTLTAEGQNDMFVTRFTTSGTCLGVVTVNDVEGCGIAQDSLGNAFVIGIYNPTADFGNIHLSSIGDYDVFIAKLSAITGAMGITEFTPDPHLEIYANPNIGRFTINMPSEIIYGGNAILSIFDNNGKLVKSENINATNNNLQVNLGHIGSGIYHVTIKNKNKLYTGSVVIR